MALSLRAESTTTLFLWARTQMVCRSMRRYGLPSGSDKRYSFRLLAREPKDKVHLFKAAIDLLSYATYLKCEGRTTVRKTCSPCRACISQKRKFPRAKSLLPSPPTCGKTRQARPLSCTWTMTRQACSMLAAMQANKSAILIIQQQVNTDDNADSDDDFMMTLLYRAH